MKVFTALALALLAVFLSCGPKLNSKAESTELNRILEIELFDLNSPELRVFKDRLLQLKVSHISLYGNMVRAYDTRKQVFYDIRVENDLVYISPPRPFERNHYMFFFGFRTPTPTFTVTPLPQKRLTTRKEIRKKFTHVPSLATPKVEPTTPSPTPTKINWTKDRIAMEILRGNSPRDENGNLIHTASGQETLAEIVEWYVGDLSKLEDVASENNQIPSDAPIVQGVRIKIPEHLVKNPKRFKKKGKD
ncbi:MAG: hypothetical protein N2654_04095 [Deltaproteobacteria bacterium]|nr:hypothetical protein [Deltaproteobacteria bacterium]